MNWQRLLRKPAERTSVQAFRFTLVGLVAFAVDYSIMVFAVEVGHWNHLVSAALGYVVGLVLNYFMCVRWVFDQRRFQDPTTEFLLFTVIGFTGLGLTELILWTGTDAIGLDYRIAKFAALFVVAVWNFLVRKLWLFSEVEFPGKRQSA